MMNLHDKRVIVGFTARDGSSQAIDKTWTPELRKIHLLDENTVLPISVDARVFHDVLKLSDFRSDDGNWVVNPAGLVARLSTFDEFIARANLDDHKLQLAITAPFDYVEELSLKRGFPDAATDAPDEASLNGHDWRLLGFDCVNFNGAISGLFNCGFKDKSRLSSEYKGHLNEYGLFVTSDMATQFSAVQNQDIPKHAPFTAAGIFLRGQLPPWYTDRRKRTK